MFVLWDNFDKVVAVVKEFVLNIGLGEKFTAIKEAVTPLLKHVGELRDLLTVVGTVILAVLQPAIAVLMGIVNGLISAIAPLITVVDGVIQIFSALGTFLLGVFT